MFEEYIVTDVRIKKNKLFLHVKDKGDVYINWEHTFPTGILSVDDKNRLYSDLKKHPVKRFSCEGRWVAKKN